MSTREIGEPPVTPPEEVRVMTGVLPANAATPTTDAPTPGVGLAGARVPGGPTLPDPDSIVFTSMLARAANELFAAPSATAMPTAAPTQPAHLQPTMLPVVGSPPSVPTTTQPTGVPASATPITPPMTLTTDASTAAPPTTPPTAAAPPSTPTAPTSYVSPFSAPLSFANLTDPSLQVGSIPLLDYPTTAPEVSEGAAPDTITPTESQVVIAHPYELQPFTGLTLERTAGGALDPNAVRREFPILEERVHGRRLIWLDNAATTQKPQVVIDRLSYFYEHENSNIHRAAHTLAARATDAYEKARDSVRRFINAPSVQEIIFVRGTTEGINLIAQSYGRRNVREGDEIVITHLEHHANIVPWQMLCSEKGAKLCVAPVDDRGQIILEEYEKLLGPQTRIVSLTQVSNALGTITPAKEMIELAHRHGAKVVVDGAQSVSHMPVDVQQLDADFFVFSGHKVFAPTGIGAVFGKRALLEAMPPWQGGGNMIQDVTFERTIYQGPPSRFEAGTGNIADAVGLGTALDWLTRLGVERVSQYEHSLVEYATPRLLGVPGLTIIGTAPDKAGVLSFVLAGKKTEEIGGMLDKEGIAVRSGHHCAQPILRRFGLEATVRASLAPYNTCEDIDALVAALHRIQSDPR